MFHLQNAEIERTHKMTLFRVLPAVMFDTEAEVTTVRKSSTQHYRSKYLDRLIITGSE